jgi:hypothetical protein
MFVVVITRFLFLYARSGRLCKIPANTILVPRMILAFFVFADGGDIQRGELLERQAAYFRHFLKSGHQVLEDKTRASETV